MKKKKFDITLSVILVIVLVIILVVVGFWGYDLVHKVSINVATEHAVNEFDQLIEEAKNNKTGEVERNKEEEGGESSGDNHESYSYDEDYDQSYPIQYQYNGFNVVGKIDIPSIDIEYPIYDVATITSMETSVGIIAGPGLNKIGNTVIMGHNYRNGTLFSKNKYLEDGDEIYITDVYGQTVRYIIYNIYTTTSSDFDYAIRDTTGRREITLASCTDDSASRLIIWAKEG